MTTTAAGATARILDTAEIPPPGMLMSIKHRSGRCSAAIANLAGDCRCVASPLHERLRGKCPRPESNQCTRFRKSRASVRTRASVSAESVVSGFRCPPSTAEYASLRVVQACPGRRLVDGSRCAYVSSESTLAHASVTRQSVRGRACSRMRREFAGSRDGRDRRAECERDGVRPRCEWLSGRSTVRVVLRLCMCRGRPDSRARRFW